VTVFDVYVERARDDSAEGRGLLAQRVAQRFGLDPASVTGLVSAGRFRVKSRVADDIARRLGAELQALGAVVSIVDAEGQPPPTADEMGMSLKIRLDAVDVSALVALDGSAGEKREVAAAAFQPPAGEGFPEEEVVELAEPEMLDARPMSVAPMPAAEAPLPPTGPLSVAPRPRTPLLAQTTGGHIAVLGGRLRDKPVLHAALGVVLALVVGFIPACLYAGHVRTHEIRPLRHEEVVLLHRPPAVPTRTAVEVRADITSIKWREFFVCAGMWLVIGGAGAWSYFRLT